MEKVKRAYRRRSAPAKVSLKPIPTATVAPLFHKALQAELPCPINLANHLGLDEFYFFDTKLSVQKTQSNRTTVSNLSIGRACDDIKRRGISACYTLDLTTNPELDSFIEIPPIVTDHSLFHKHWPVKQSSIFFRERSKLYHAYQDGYKSYPHLAYGGLTEWIHVLRGRLSITVVEPTKLNLARFECLDQGEEFVIEPGTHQEYVLRGGSFLSIPAGHISIKKAMKSTCALGGEMLHPNDLVNQLESFKRDVRRTNGRHASDRDPEIRHLYWFYSVYTLSPRTILDSMDPSNVQSLRQELTNWAHRYRIANGKEETYENPNLYAPIGIQVSTILNDMRYTINNRKKKDSSKAKSSQTSDDDEISSPTAQASVQCKM